MVERFKPELETPSLHNPCYSASMRKTENGMWVHYLKYKQSQRALWLARAERAKAMMHVFAYNAGKFPKWAEVERKCREKAEEYTGIQIGVDVGTGKDYTCIRRPNEKA